MSVVAIVPAAGRGERLGAAQPKALVTVGDVPLLTHAVHGLLLAGVDRVVVAAPADHLAEATAAVCELGNVLVVAGGADRTGSVRIALAHAADASVVLVHDAARAFTPESVIRSVVAAVRAGAPAVIPVLPVTDTIKVVDQDGVVTGTQDRTLLRAVQTPQGFDPAVLRRAYDAAGDAATDDAGLVERIGVPVATVPGHPHAMKVTTPFDLAVATAVLA